MELPTRHQLVEAVGIIQPQRPKGGHQLYTQSGSTEELGWICVSGIGPEVPCIEEGREVQLHIFHVQVCNTGDKANKDESGNTKCGKNGRGKGISIGVNQDFDDYAVLVGEIVDMMNKKCHSEDVEEMLQLLQLPESCLADEVQASTTS